MARNDSKPQRGGNQESWVLHASPEWTGKYLDDKPEDVLPRMLDAFWQATGVNAPRPSYAASHRWRCAMPPEPLEDRCLFDPHCESELAVIGAAVRAWKVRSSAAWPCPVVCSLKFDTDNRYGLCRRPPSLVSGGYEVVVAEDASVAILTSHAAKKFPRRPDATRA